MKQKYTAYNLVRAISQLPRNVNYNYVNPTTKGLIRIENVLLPAGPIQIRRWNPTKLETPEKAKSIIEYRNSIGSFSKVEDIKNVTGIGDSIFDKIKDYITI